MLKSTVFQLCGQTRRCSSLFLRQAKPELLLDEKTKSAIEKDELKPRKHSGISYKKNIELPEWVTKKINDLISGNSRKEIMEDAAKFYRHLAGRHPPAEREEVETRLEELKRILREEKRVQAKLPADEETADDYLTRRALKVIKTNVKYCSRPIEFNSYKCLLYLVARGAQDYAVLYKIFHEIKTRDKEFKLRTLLDFGSGISTVSWAATQFWVTTLKEQVCVDASAEMNDFADEIAKNAEPKLKGVFRRQYLPVASPIRFDMVVSAFSLIDLPDRRSRLEVILNLWRKTDKYLVLVELGTNAGFKVINEARDMIIHLLQSSKEEKGEEAEEGHIFSPCPHELPCPRVAVADGTPCNFPVRHTPFTGNRNRASQEEYFSYIVFKKGAQKTDDEKKWPRLVRPTLVRSRHAICRMCIPSGKLMEVIFSVGKHERPMYRCARKSDWGDRLPMEIVREKKE